MTEQEIRIEQLEKEVEILKKRVDYFYEKIRPSIKRIIENIDKIKEDKCGQILFKHPELGGRRVVIRGFKLDDGMVRCELCGNVYMPKDLGTLTVTHKDTGETEKHSVCLKCGKKLGGTE